MESPDPEAVAGLPTFAALDAYAVLAGHRRGTSIQVDSTYFDGQTTVMDAVEGAALLSDRREIAVQSRQVIDQIQVEFDELTEQTLWTASERLVEIYQQLPELQYLDDQFPETCFVVPEWIRTTAGVRYGARIYFFAGDAPDPTEIVRTNIQALIEESDGEFEAHLGRLHGYPDCCLDYFATFDRQGTAPELESIASIEESIHDDTLGQDPLSTAVETATDGLFETERAYAFFTREFFPEPGCDRARTLGRDIFEDIRDTYGETLARDFIRLNAGWSYLMAQGVAAETDTPSRPAPGTLGREHLLFYLPLSVTTSFSRYSE